MFGESCCHRRQNTHELPPPPRSSAVGHYYNWDILCDQFSGIEAHLLYDKLPVNYSI